NCHSLQLEILRHLVSFAFPEHSLQITQLPNYSITQSQLPNYQITQLPNRFTQSPHSYRSATIGSTLVARRAGIKPASNATVASTAITAPREIGSVAFKPKRSEDNS